MSSMSSTDRKRHNRALKRKIENGFVSEEDVISEFRKGEASKPREGKVPGKFAKQFLASRKFDEAEGKKKGKEKHKEEGKEEPSCQFTPSKGKG